MFSMNQAPAAVMINHEPRYNLKYDIDMKQSKVYFGANEIAGSDAISFIIFEESGYAKDKNHVYLEGAILSSLDPAETHYLGYGRLRDNQSVYVGNIIIIDADPHTYQVLVAKDSTSYGKDKNFVYYGREKKAFIDKDTITPLSNKYAKDKNSVYFWGNKIADSDGASFVALSNDIGKDKHHVYSNDKIIVGADTDTFVVLNVDSRFNIYGRKMNGYGYAKDKKYVFYLGKIVENTEPQTFVQPPYEHIQL